MGLRNTTTGWGWLARLLHWSIAGIILFLLGLGYYMTEIVTDVFEQFPLFQIVFVLHSGFTLQHPPGLAAFDAEQHHLT